MNRARRIWIAFYVLLGASFCAEGRAAENMFSNPGFEIGGIGGRQWRMDKGRKTEARFTVNREEAAEGDYSALVTIGKAGEWTQFGQSVDAGEKGKTYTFAVLAKAVKEPVTVSLEIERRAKPYDRAVRGASVVLEAGRWTELHTTFTVARDFPEGWFAYISCAQPNCEYRADMFRLYEGDYVPYEKIAQEEEAAVGVRVTQTSDNEMRVANNYVTLVARKGVKGVVVAGRGDVPVTQSKETMLIAVGRDGEAAKAITSFHLIENTPAKALLEVNSTTGAGRSVTARYAFKKNKPFFEAQAGQGMEWLRVEGRSRYAIVPDIFAGDFVVNPATVRVARLRMPSENLVLQLADGGNAIVACAWRSNDQAVRLALDGAGDARAIVATEIGCGQGFPVTVAVLTAPAIWHEAPIKSLDPVKDTKLDWKVPFRALWRADCQRTDGLIDSWKCILRDAKGHYEGFGVEPKKSRTVWTSARGTFAYPVCIEGGACFLRKSKFEAQPDIQYDDEHHVVIYPYQAISGSPPGAFGALDVLRDALKDVPEAVLLESMEIKHVERDRWPATCAVTAEYEKVFDAGEEKAKKKLLLERLDAMDNFVINIRSRMNEFLAWQKKTREFITKAKTEKPQLAVVADEFDGILAQFDKIYERRKLDERTPAAARVLIEKVAALIDSNEDNKDEKAKQLGRDTRTIGGNQDSAIGEFRMFTKRLRQRAAQRMAEAPDDAAFEFAREVRRRTMEMLQFAFGHESAHTD